MEAPPYSPTATSDERRLPNDYSPVERREEHEDPLESLSRTQGKNAPSSPRSARSRHYRHASQASTSSFSSVGRYLQPIATAPATTTTFSFQDSFETPPELPPQYAAVDALARSFRLAAPFIYTTRTSSLPRYQLMQEFTRSGRPKKINIRRLMPTESRSHSLPTPALSCGPTIRYDEDSTMYSIACYELQGLAFSSYEMRGHRSSTLGGKIKVESGKSLFGGRWSKIWHLTKNARKDSLNPENEARMHKYGYHASHEWDKRLLYRIKKGVWTDEDGLEVARESGKGEFEVCETIGEESWKRDLAVSCWIMKLWVSEGLRWENDVKGW